MCMQWIGILFKNTVRYLKIIESYILDFLSNCFTSFYIFHGYSIKLKEKKKLIFIVKVVIITIFEDFWYIRYLNFAFLSFYIIHILICNATQTRIVSGADSLEGGGVLSAIAPPSGCCFLEKFYTQYVGIYF